MSRSSRRARNPRSRYAATTPAGVRSRRANRAAILESAHRRFLEQGYAATTVGEVAGDAGVSVETIYKAFANKAGLLKAVFDVSVAGDDDPVPMAERDVIGQIIAEPDAATKLRLYADHMVESMPAPRRCSSWRETRLRSTPTPPRCGRRPAPSSSKA